MSILKVGMYASSRIGANQNYLTFSSSNPFSISFTAKHWDGVLEYSLDAQHWYEWDASEINSSGNVLYLRGRGNSYITGASDLSYAMQITATSGVECTGNIMALLNHMNPDNAVMGHYAFASLFWGQDKLITSPELPATALTNYCYANMFRDTGIVVAPELPATVLADWCCLAMFAGTGIEVAPELPAMTLALRCYSYMFDSCMNLIAAPELPATVLAEHCYSHMLYMSSVKISSTKTGIYQTPWRIPTNGTISGTPTGWRNNMLWGTSGTFTGNPAINTTYYQAT